MGKYIFTKDFEATEYRFKGDAAPPKEGNVQILQKKSFKKGDIVSGSETKDFALNKHITAMYKVGGGAGIADAGSDVTFDITNGVTPYSGTATVGSNTNTTTTTSTDNKTTATTIFTTKNIIIGLTFIAVVFGILKWQKVI